MTTSDSGRSPDVHHPTDESRASPPAAIEAGHEHAGSDQASGPRRHLWIFVAFAAVAGFFLLTEHRAHALGLLPYLLVAACPLMHLLMHRGHGSHRSGSHGSDERRQ